MTIAENSAKEIGKIIKNLRKAKGLNQEELAAVLGVRKTTVSNYETGYSRPTGLMLRKMADYFAVSLDFILPPGVQAEGGGASVPSTGALSLQEASFSPDPNFKYIPLYHSLGSDFAGFEPACVLHLPLSLVGEGNFFALRVSGDRMDRSALTDGSIAIVRRQSFADDGDIAVVSVNGESAMFGRVYRAGTGTTITAESSNLSHRPVAVETGDASLVFLGKVIQVIQSVL